MSSLCWRNPVRRRHDPRDPDRQALFDVTSEQRGHFTTDQAAKAGYARDMLTYHIQRGIFQRLHRGVYRFLDYASSPATR